jgi:tetratricopeptide (TPR) repeat protein
MRVVPAALLAVCLSSSALPVSWAVPRAAAAEPSQQSAEALYESGRKAYRLGRFKESVEKWEEAYALSEQPLLLYNISLAYKGLFTITDDVADLRKARAVLENFITLAAADPDLDADDAPERLAELDQMIAEAQEGRSPPTGVVIEPVAPKPLTDDPGKQLRVAGAVSMGVGGGLVILGAALAAYYGVKGAEFRDDVQRLTPEQRAACDAMAVPVEMQSLECRRLDWARDSGRTANLGLGLSLGIAGGIGLAALAAGAVMFVQGNRRSRAWQETWLPGSKHVRIRDLRIDPTRGGVSIRGRF